MLLARYSRNLEMYEEKKNKKNKKESKNGNLQSDYLEVIITITPGIIAFIVKFGMLLFKFLFGVKR